MIVERYEGRDYALKLDAVTGHGSYCPVPSPDVLERYYNGGFTMGATAPTPASEFRPELKDVMQGVVNHVVHYGMTPKFRFHDVGCGFGAGVWGMQQIGQDASGNEMNREWIETANPHCKHSLFYGSLEAVERMLPAMDVFFCSHVLEHLPDPQTTIDTMARKLRKGGMAYLIMPNGASYMAKKFGVKSTKAYSFPMHLQLFTPQSLADMVKRAGLEILEANTRAFDEGEKRPDLKPIAERLKDNEGGELFILARKT